MLGKVTVRDRATIPDASPASHLVDLWVGTARIEIIVRGAHRHDCDHGVPVEPIGENELFPGEVVSGLNLIAFVLGESHPQRAVLHPSRIQPLPLQEAQGVGIEIIVDVVATVRIRREIGHALEVPESDELSRVEALVGRIPQNEDAVCSFFLKVGIWTCIH